MSRAPSLCAALAWLSLAQGCDVRSGMVCQVDAECGAFGVCIQGLCFSRDAVDAGSPSAECDAGEWAGCVRPLGEMCLLGRRVCDGGTWGTCVATSGSGDAERCGASCGSCGVGSDRCEQGICKCGSAAACLPGLHCLGGSCACDAVSCARGCCANSSCTPIAFPWCGLPGGGACARCDETLADRCSAFGGCQCGLGPQCSPGQRCSQGTCVCDAQSCSQGCCDDSTCRPSSLSSCGTLGRRCVSCDPLRADTCLGTGACACGANPACSTGQRCLKGLCICDPCSSSSAGASERPAL